MSRKINALSSYQGVNIADRLVGLLIHNDVEMHVLVVLVNLELILLWHGGAVHQGGAGQGGGGGGPVCDQAAGDGDGGGEDICGEYLYPGGPVCDAG